MTGTGPCPGCGLVLPTTTRAPSGRLGASAGCEQVHDLVTGFEAEHLRLARFRQLRVDAYGAQHPQPPTPPIRLAYALVGLHLALDRGIDGIGVRQAHSRMGKPRPDWPRFAERDRSPAELTVDDVAGAGARPGSVTGHATAVVRWAGAVWASWDVARDDVVRLTERLFPGGTPFRPDPGSYEP